MTLPAPKLDDLTWADMMAAIRRRIPAESGGRWTLHALALPVTGEVAAETALALTVSPPPPAAGPQGRGGLLEHDAAPMTLSAPLSLTLIGGLVVIAGLLALLAAPRSVLPAPAQPAGSTGSSRPLAPS